MSDKLRQCQQRLSETLYDLYEIGGLELMQAGTRGLKRDLIIGFDETNTTTDESFHLYKQVILLKCTPN